MKSLIVLLALVVVGVTSYKASHISYSLWSDTPNPFVSENFTIDTNVLNVTFYDVMTLQAWLQPEIFSFKTEQVSDYGRLVTSIGGLANNDTEKVAWQLFMLPEYPNIENGIPDDSLRANTGVDNIWIEDKQHFLFIYLDTRPGSN